jgi:hypothetical protein
MPHKTTVSMFYAILALPLLLFSVLSNLLQPVHIGMSSGCGNTMKFVPSHGIDTMSQNRFPFFRNMSDYSIFVKLISYFEFSLWSSNWTSLFFEEYSVIHYFLTFKLPTDWILIIEWEITFNCKGKFSWPLNPLYHSEPITLSSLFVIGNPKWKKRNGGPNCPSLFQRCCFFEMTWALFLRQQLQYRK